MQFSRGQDSSVSKITDRLAVTVDNNRQTAVTVDKSEGKAVITRFDIFLQRPNKIPALNLCCYSAEIVSYFQFISKVISFGCPCHIPLKQNG